MNLKPIGSNMTQVRNGDFVVLFSYSTPVAAIDVQNQKVYKTDKKWSVTTSKHISKWFSTIIQTKMCGLVAFNPMSVSQEQIEHMSNGVNPFA